LTLSQDFRLRELQKRWKKNNGGKPAIKNEILDVNDIFNDKVLQEIEDNLLADLDYADLAVEDEDNDDQALNTVLGKRDEPNRVSCRLCHQCELKMMESLQSFLMNLMMMTKKT